jgi:hypothetical protein
MLAAPKVSKSSDSEESVHSQILKTCMSELDKMKEDFSENSETSDSDDSVKSVKSENSETSKESVKSVTQISKPMESSKNTDLYCYELIKMHVPEYLQLYMERKQTWPYEHLYTCMSKLEYQFWYFDNSNGDCQYDLHYYYENDHFRKPEYLKNFFKFVHYVYFKVTKDDRKYDEGLVKLARLLGEKCKRYQFNEKEIELIMTVFSTTDFDKLVEDYKDKRGYESESTEKYFDVVRYHPSAILLLTGKTEIEFCQYLYKEKNINVMLSVYGRHNDKPCNAKFEDHVKIEFPLKLYKKLPKESDSE